LTEISGATSVRGLACSIQWMIDYAFEGDNVRAEYAQKSLLSEKYQVFVSIVRLSGRFSSCG
jgi:hypothetical protein